MLEDIIEIASNGKMNNPQKYILNFATKKVEKLNKEEYDNNCINYYWVEFQYKEEKYKISMFYKDFDHNTGNIHILPGAIQFWKKTYCSTKSICEKELYNYKKIISTYCECRWAPLCTNPIFWDTKNIGEMSRLVWQAFEEVNPSEIYDKKIYSNEFYRSVNNYFSSKLPKEEGKREIGHYQKYSIIRWVKKNEKQFVCCYKIEEFSGYGYFTKYDGNRYEYTAPQKDGPNCFKNGKWELNYD